MTDFALSLACFQCLWWQSQWDQSVSSAMVHRVSFSDRPIWCFRLWCDSHYWVTACQQKKRREQFKTLKITPARTRLPFSAIFRPLCTPKERVYFLVFWKCCRFQNVHLIRQALCDLVVEVSGFMIIRCEVGFLYGTWKIFERGKISLQIEFFF